MDLATGLLSGLPPVVAVAIICVFLYRVIRRDAESRLLAYCTTLERRIERTETRQAKVERQLARERRRRYQLEAVLAAAGTTFPPWTLDPDDLDDPDLDFDPPLPLPEVT